MVFTVYSDNLGFILQSTQINCNGIANRRRNLVSIWQLCQPLRQRAQENEDDFSQWLLAVGNGETLCHDEGVPSNCISIPEQCHIANDIVDDVFDDVSNPRNLTNTIILTPTNASSLKIKDQVLEKVNGEKRIYFSNDSAITENPEDAENFPPELLHSLTPSGMPPHRLVLKQGAIVMLLRNLDIKKGYVMAHGYLSVICMIM